jgi:hypothetical protein
MAIDSLSAIGKPDSMITFTGANGAFYRGIYADEQCKNHLEYCIFENGSNQYGGGSYLRNMTKVHNCIFRYFSTSDPVIQTKPGGDYRYNVFYNIDNTYVYWLSTIRYEGISDFRYNVVVNNKTNHPANGVAFKLELEYTDEVKARIKKNVFMNNIGTQSFDFGIGWSQNSINYVDTNYWGTPNIDEVRSHILDFFEDPQKPVLEPVNIMESPPAECHGVVWKVEINEQNPQELSDYMIVDGVVKFDVFFNRAMDISVEPLVSFGVRFPFTQNIVSDSISWSADSTIWTGYYTTSMYTGDGLNTIRVAYAKDNESFEIPIEYERFRFIIQEAGSQSINFTAVPGIGKVNLLWPESDSLDVLGYNLYRHTKLSDTLNSDTLLVNQELLTDTAFIDYQVTPDITYYYLYNILTTQLTSSDYSKVVAATPFSTANGDANGDLTVNVLDITTIVSYILNQNPQPFLSDAADVNYDGQINLLDIIGVVNLIMNNKAVSDRPYPMISQQKAYYEWRGNQLWLHSLGNVAGLQFELALPENLEADQLRIKSRLPGFEMASQMQAANIQGLLYSLDGKTIPSGENCLLELIGADLPAELQFNTILGGELEGDLVEVLPYGIDDLPEQSTEQQVLRVQPNPFSHQLLISWDVPEANKVALRLYDQQGRLIKSLYEGNDVSGNTYWEGKDQHNKSVSKGVYILRMELQQKEGLQSVERKIIFN